MKKLIALFLIISNCICYSQTNSIVTEYYLANRFTPLPGVTPGSNNIIAMSDDQIVARYYCNMITPYANHLASQNKVLPIIRFTYWFYFGQEATFSFPSSKLLLISIWSSSSRTGGSPTIAGNSLTKIGQQGNTELWYYVGSFSGSNSVQVPNTGGADIYSTGAAFTYDATLYLYSNSSNTGSNSISSNLSIQNGKQVLIFRANGFNGNGASSFSDISYPTTETYVQGLTYGTPTRGSVSFWKHFYADSNSYSTYTTLTSGTATIDEVSATFYVY